MGIEDVIEQQVVNLTTLLTRQVVMNELAMTPDSIATLFRAAIAQLPLTNRQLTIRIHPDDLSLVQKGISESEQASWTWIEDKSLTRGGLDIDSIDTHIDATVETRLKSAIEKLLGEPE
jgi:flagellar assembly protein FliH